VKSVGCCDNGACFCCCPWLNCTGHVKMLSLESNSQEEKVVFAKGLYPCWPCVQCCAMFCAPLGVVCLSMKGCCQYCSEEEFMTITQPVYAGPWSRDSGAEPSQIGNMNLAFRFVPMSCCCACPKPLKVWFDPTTEQGQKVGAENIALLSVILAIYRGLDNPCKMCAGKDFQQPTGVSCLDLGLNTTVVWRNLGAVMKDSA